jgi:hypothetical protein
MSELAKQPEVDHVQLLVAIARLEGKVDALNERLGEKHSRDAMVFSDHEKRIRINEQARIKTTALSGIVAVVLSFITTYLLKREGF